MARVKRWRQRRHERRQNPLLIFDIDGVRVATRCERWLYYKRGRAI